MSERPATTNVVGAVYGQVLVTSVLAAASEDSELGCGALLAQVVTTMLVFWAAHVYAEALSHRVDAAGHLHWRELREIMLTQWPIVQAAGPSSLVLILGAMGVLSRNSAVGVAIGLGVLALFSWGFAIARRSRRSVIRSLVSGLASGGLGLLIVALKLIVH